MRRAVQYLVVPKHYDADKLVSVLNSNARSAIGHNLFYSSLEASRAAQTLKALTREFRVATVTFEVND